VAANNERKTPQELPSPRFVFLELSEIANAMGTFGHVEVLKTPVVERTFPFFIEGLPLVGGCNESGNARNHCVVVSSAFIEIADQHSRPYCMTNEEYDESKSA
jgi:hypothetical protein